MAASGGGDPLGDLDILVGGDTSPLNDALASISDSVTAAASAVNSALSNTDGADKLTTSVEGTAAALSTVSTAATTAGTSADTAASSMGMLADATGRTGTSADQADSALKRLSDDMAGLKQQSDSTAQSVSSVGEAFSTLGQIAGITLSIAALKSFAEESLGAYGALQRADLSLTELTGDAQVAAGILGQLKTLALDDALSFPTLVAAGQKMVALEYTSEQVVTTLKSVANAAAATGQSIDIATMAVDRISLSGQTAARQLATLGLSTHDLAAAMGVTANEVKTAFAALDQSQRLQVLNDAMTKFSGTAQAAAQGIVGQFQTLKTELGGDMVAIGAALAPVAEDLIHWLENTTSAIKPVIASTYDWVTAATESAHSVGLQNDALVALAAAVAINPYAGLAVAAADFGSAALQAIKAQRDLDAATLTANTSLATMEITLRQQGIDISALRQQYETGAISLQQYLSQVQQLVVAYRALHPVQQAAAADSDELSKGAQAIADKVTSLNKAYQDAKAVYQEYVALAQRGAVSDQEVQAAHTAMQTAFDAANPTVKEAALSFQSLADNAKIANDTLALSKTAFLQTEAAFLSGKSSLAAYDSAWQQYAKDAKAAGLVADDVTHSVIAQTQAATANIAKLTSLIDTFEVLDSIEGKTVAQNLATVEAFKAMTAEATKLGLTVTDAGDHLEFGYTQKAAEAGTASASLKQHFVDLYGQTDAYTVLVNGKVTPVLQSLSDGLAKNITQAGGFTSSMESITDAAGNAAGKIEVLRGSSESLSTSLDATTQTIVNAKGQTVSLTDEVKRLNDAWWAAAQAQGNYRDAASLAAGEIDDETGSITNETDAVVQQTSAVNALAEAWDQELSASTAAASSKATGGKGASQGQNSAVSYLEALYQGGANSSMVDAAAKALGLVVLGNGQYADPSYVASLPTLPGKDFGAHAATSTVAASVGATATAAATTGKTATSTALNDLITTEQQYQSTLNDTIDAYKAGTATMADVQAALDNYNTAMSNVQAATGQSVAASETLSRAIGSQANASQTLATVTQATSQTVTQAATGITGALTATATAATTTATAVAAAAAAMQEYAKTTVQTTLGAAAATQQASTAAANLGSTMQGVARAMPTWYGPIAQPGDLVSGISLAVANALATASSQPTANVTVNLSAGTVVGQNGMQQLAQTVGNIITTQLRQVTGLKIP